MKPDIEPILDDPATEDDTEPSVEPHVPSLTSAEAEARATMANVSDRLAQLRSRRHVINGQIRDLVEQENELRPVINAFDRAAKRRGDAEVDQ